MNAETLIAEPVMQSGIQPDLIIGLVNNAAAPAVAATERQFRAMLELALPGKVLTLKLYRSSNLMNDGPLAGLCGTRYASLADLLNARAPARLVDALLVTGMQPQADRLQDEPVWPGLAQLAEWAEQRAVPVLWSCLAAHAAMLHLDGIGRVRLTAKLSGLYACEAVDPGHTLLSGLPSRWITPHSRYNGVLEACLAANGYEVLSRSAEAGPDTALRRGTAPSLFFQGHPEYDSDTLLKEYRRDAKRFFSGATGEFPAVPAAYFEQCTEQALTTLRARTLGQKRDPAFQEQMLAVTDRATYRSASRLIGARLVANWLLAACSFDVPAPSAPVLQRAGFELPQEAWQP